MDLSHKDAIAVFARMVRSVQVGTDGCWRLRSPLDEKGYALASVRGKTTKAHRVAFMAAHGHNGRPCVLHSCDTRCCVNPAHLREGTQKENMADRTLRGRTAIGFRNGKCKHSGAVIAELRQLRASGVSVDALAAQFGIPPTTVYGFVSLKRRVHVVNSQREA